MMDPMTSLSFTLQSNRGRYGLLLGSGISRSAGIPTGWEVVLDLIRKVAAVESQDCEPEPEKWYQNRFERPADYSQILSFLAKTPAERNQLLKAYFEPPASEGEDGLGLPTPAHRAIAGLVVDGYIKVILTTNFDRLLEKAIEDRGGHVAVISSPDAMEGALPIQHTQCTLIKLHGDYMDVRIKNTPEELMEYDERIDRILDRVLDEFGLIICGWSAEWDEALCKALERCKTRRFSTYWAVRGMPTERAKRLIDHRGAQTITISDANEFFGALAEKVKSIEDFSRPHPISAKIAVATIKRYLSEDRHRILLHDLVMTETERLYEQISDVRFLCME